MSKTSSERLMSVQFIHHVSRMATSSALADYLPSALKIHLAGNFKKDLDLTKSKEAKDSFVPSMRNESQFCQLGFS